MRFYSKMKFFIFCLLLPNVFSLFYHFGTTFGKIFRDLDNSDLDAVNGDSIYNDELNVYLTDRGAYFYAESSAITLPPNDYCSTSFNFASNFSLFMWIYPTDKPSVRFQSFFYRYKDSSNFIYIMRDSSLSRTAFQIANNDFVSSELFGTSDLLPLGKI
jgi:hypothetical protein